MNPLRRLALWVFRSEWISLGPLAPHVLGFALGSRAQRVPVLALKVQPCLDRCTKGFEHRFPELKAAGRCNSSHGGSCCVCGGHLPDGHFHLWGPNSFNPEWQGCCGDDVGFGGNVCTERCVHAFVQWLEDRPPKMAICPGHGYPTPVPYRHQRHSVKLQRVPA